MLELTELVEEMAVTSTGKLDKNEPILVADFGVKGNADSSLAGVVSEALRTDLGQSTVLRVVSARLTDTRG